MLVAGSDWYPLWLRRYGYLATCFRGCTGLYIALRCCLGGHRWILIALAGCLFNYCDGYWKCCRENNEPITDTPTTDTDAHKALRESVKSAYEGNDELVPDALLPRTVAHNAPHDSTKSAWEEDNELVPNAMFPGTEAYSVLLESFKSACMKDNEWIIDTYKIGLDSVRSLYARLFEKLKQDSVRYIKGKSYPPKKRPPNPFRHEVSISKDISCILPASKLTSSV